MKSNINSTDRILRAMFAAVVAIFYFTNTIAGPLSIALIVAAAIILLTSVLNFCPIYYALGISTNKRKFKQHA
jgi:hypothetical protein